MQKYSFSKMGVALNCLRRFHEQYDNKRWESPTKDRSALVMGDAFHKFLEVFITDYADRNLQKYIVPARWLTPA